MTALLTAEGLELAYGQVPACRDITFHVEEGEVVTLRHPVPGTRYYSLAFG